MSEYALGIDVGGTTIKVTLADRAGQAELRRTLPTPAGVEPLVATVAALVRDLRAETPAAVGVVVPGIVDEATGTAVLSANLGWRDAPMLTLLQAALPAERLVLGHDVRAGALAESRWGAGAPDMLYVPIGTGIAAGVVLAGRTLSTGGYAGEVGQVLVADPDGAGRVVLEQVASASAIARRHGARTGREPDGARAVVDLAAAGDADAAAVLEQAVAALAEVLAAAVGVLGPVRLVIGGGLAGAGEVLLAPLRAAIAERLVVAPAPQVVPAVLGSWAQALGAAALAFDHVDGGAP